MNEDGFKKTRLWSCLNSTYTIENNSQKYFDSNQRDRDVTNAKTDTFSWLMKSLSFVYGDAIIVARNIFKQLVHLNFWGCLWMCNMDTTYLDIKLILSSCFKDTYGFMPWTASAVGNLFLMVAYGYLLIISASMMSNGNEIVLLVMGQGSMPPRRWEEDIIMYSPWWSYVLEERRMYSPQWASTPEEISCRRYRLQISYFIKKA